MSSKRAQRRRECERKRRYTEDEARQLSSRLAWSQNQRISAYKCRFCKGWHVGHTPGKIRQAMAARRAEEWV